ncbi:MAG: thioredoxin family protein [Lentisphaeria bacterium]|nr:thioredoxin family protein [Lentisphaeria bacterium]
MPRPPILPILDRKTIFHSGLEYDQWLNQAEEDAHREKMLERYEQVNIPLEIQQELILIERKVNIIAIAESWCGDVIRHTPLLQRLVGQNHNLTIRFVTREQHPELFVRYLTNSGEAIPKFIFCNEEFIEVGNWGPMSTKARRMIAIGKGLNDVATARQKVSAYYQHNHDEDACFELLDLILIAAGIAKED